MILKILLILYVLFILSILLLGIFYIISIFICRKRKNCQKRFCPLRSHCGRIGFTEKERREIAALIASIDEKNKTDKSTSSPKPHL